MRSLKITILCLVFTALLVFIALGSAGYFTKTSTYKVCYYDAIEGAPNCAEVKATSYTLTGGCARFHPSDSAVCGVFFVVRLP